MWATLAGLKLDMGITDTRDDAKLSQVLDAATAFVEQVRPAFNYAGDEPDLPVPDAALVLGTYRLAARWHTRRRSPDALIQLAEMGASRVPSFDVDIDRLLRIGPKYAPPVIA
ncbi:phage head-tail connector protein [Micromonospora sp. NPDC050417]|uniref:phage head-tail connector protein n=1 Tax=Micromonospora sp. NPDC050417 TaxID=3364280 RepID=UPI0037AE7C95